MFFGHGDHFAPSTADATSHAQAAQEPSEEMSSRKPAPTDCRDRFCANFSKRKGISPRTSHTDCAFKIPPDYIKKPKLGQHCTFFTFFLKPEIRVWDAMDIGIHHMSLFPIGTWSSNVNEIGNIDVDKPAGFDTF